MIHFIRLAVYYSARSICKVATEGTPNEYLYVKVKPILELESRDLC